MKTRIGRALSAAVALLVAAGLSPALPASALAYSGGTYIWEWQNPFPRERQVNSVSAASATVAWAVGDYGRIYHWNGTTLSRQTGPTDANLYAVDALPGATTTAWAVGQAGTIIRTTDSGATWTAQTSNTPYDLTGVTVITATNVYAVGGRDGFTDAVILRYNGTAWSVQQTYPTGGLNDIHAIDANNIWAVGQTPGVDTGRTLYCNGSTWVERDTNYAMTSVDAYTSAGIYYVWGVTWNGTVVYSSNGGISYTEMFTEDWPASVTGIWSATAPNHRVWVCGWEGRMRYYDGATWTNQTSNTTTDICDVDAFGATGQFSVGYSNFLSNTGTTAWTRREGSVAVNQLNRCVSSGADYVWAVGAGGRIVRSSNGGTTWAVQTSGVTYDIRDIDAASATVLYAAGNARAPRKTTNGGTTWAVTGNPVNQTWYGVAAADATNVWVAGTNGTVSKTINGGTSWTSQTANAGTNIIRDIDCVDVNNAMLVGDAGVISTTTDGATWTARTSGTTNNLMAVSMANASVAWAVGAGGVIHRTANGGATWQAETSPTTQTLNGVTAIDTTRAWAVGAGGQVLYRDGATWSVHSTFGNANLYGVFAWDANNAWAVGLTTITSGNASAILFADPPYIKSVSPDHGDPGDTVDVEVVGGYTRFLGGTPVLDFGAGVSMVPGSLVVLDNTTLFARVQVEPGAAIGPRDVNVMTGSETPVPLAGGFNVGSNPAITSASPGLRPRGWTGDVEITGSQTGFDDSSRATFGGGVTVNSTTRVDSRRVTANVTVSRTAAPGPRDVNVTTGTETPVPLAAGFTVATPPAITGISPASGPPGSLVTVTGTGFGDDQYPGGGAPASSVGFNGLPSGPVTEWSDTHVRCAVPGGATSGPVTVTTPDGTSNADRRFTVTSPPAKAPTWYLAEGSNAWGFSTDIAVMNPNNREVTVRPVFMTPGGPVTKPDIKLPANSSRTISPGSEYGLYSDFSTRIECLEGETIAVDRTMRWAGGPDGRPEGHTSVGVTAPAREWYFAEGSSAWGFESWLAVQNPNRTEATCELTYMMDGAGPVTVRKKVPPDSRRAYSMADDIGARDASVKVTSDVPVIAERSMYRDGRRLGHCSIGAAAPAADFYLAEGSTAWGFTTYVLVQNPNPAPADVTITHMTPSGAGAAPTITVPADSRATVRLNDTMPGTDLSTKVSGSLPIVAERAMYWDTGAGEAGHSSIGLSAPRSRLFLPGGQSGQGLEAFFETWTLVQNPNGAPVEVRLTYLTHDGKGNKQFTRTMAPGSRQTFLMADTIDNTRAGVVVECLTPGRGVMAERATYWDTAPGGRSAGANTVGAHAE